MTGAVQLRTCLWFDTGGIDAARFYTTLLPDSIVETEAAPGENPLIVNFTLAGVPYQIISTGPTYTASPAASIAVMTEDQAEADRLWAALTADGGSESRCGWLTDRWGVSWQIYPQELIALLNAPDLQAAARAQQAMLQMTKIEIAEVRRAFGGDTPA